MKRIKVRGRAKVVDPNGAFVRDASEGETLHAIWAALDTTPKRTPPTPREGPDNASATSATSLEAMNEKSILAQARHADEAPTWRHALRVLTSNPNGGFTLEELVDEVEAEPDDVSEALAAFKRVRWLQDLSPVPRADPTYRIGTGQEHTAEAQAKDAGIDLDRPLRRRPPR